ncbi:uncharacterized protein N7498_002236 [Penicillium cinerascens]|uniref:Uncharacterized protein n=1 Tax=Penicillium cinerascens TaxID=70096 RepID=A0A9W9NBG6_9EURO|nr:uncharacterized protein N7498_002236 [Penicillium cinerascens]KAJ5215829.1 hypothetical protein N7498_002236 [Penicillium cinerascens]
MESALMNFNHIEGGYTFTDVINVIELIMDIILRKCALNEYLENPNGLLRCDPLIFRNAPIKARFCPFCLGNKKLLPSKRMIQFVVSSLEWYSHIEDHLNELKENFHCEHLACLLKFDSLEALTCYLTDTHCRRPRRESLKKRKFELDDTT